MLKRLPNAATLSTKSKATHSLPAARIPWMQAAILGTALTALLTAGSASAQYRASIEGTVTDPSGAAIPNAELSLTDLSTNLTTKTKADAHGIFHFNQLPADKFRLVVRASGFANKTLDGVSIIPEQPNAVNVTLAVGSTASEVSVNSGEVPALDTATASINGTITSNQIQHLPSFDRDVFRLVALAPGTFGDEAQSNGGNAKNMPGENQAAPAATDAGIFKTENNPQVIGNGSQVNANNIMIDGIQTSSANWGGATVVTPSEDSVEYVKVSSNAYDAEFGRFSGNAIQITSKSGSNSYHGSAFFKANRPGLNAWTRWNGTSSVDPLNLSKTPSARGLAKDTARFNQFGGSLGGAILKNKLFAFFNYEGFRNGSTVFATNLYETPQFDSSAPANSIAAQYLKFPGEGVPNGTVVSTNCSTSLGIPDGPYCKTVNGALDVGSPLKTPLGSYDTTWKSKTQPGIGNGLDGIPDLQLLSTTGPNSTAGDQYYGRLDGDVTSKDRLSFIIYWVPLQTDSYNGPARPANLWHHSQINNAFTGLYDRTFSPTLFNEARVSASGWRWNETASNPQAPFGLPQDTFVGVGSTEPQYFGPPSPSVFNQWSYAYQDILTKVLGGHNLKAGGTLTHIEFLNENVSAARPSFTLNSLWDFLNDAPFSESGTFSPLTGVPALNRQDARENIAGIFAQDDYKVTHNLTVNLGLRWNYFGPFYTKQNNLSVAVPGQGSALLTGLTMREGGNLYTVQKGNFGPQLGFAWTPESMHHNAVVRGGFGMNYNEDEFAITLQGNQNSPTLVSFSQSGYGSKNPAIQYNIAQDVHSPLGFASNTYAKSSVGTNGLPTGATTTSITGFDQHVKTIMVMHYSLDTELALPANFVATLGYTGSEGRHLLYQMNLNAYAVAHGAALNPNVSSYGYYANGANSNYNALLATIKHNFSHSFQAQANYTWSKSMDEGSDPYNQDPYAPISIHYAYGRSDYQAQNAFRVFGLYQPNFFHEKWLHTFADGWSIGGIYTYHSGFPWNPVYPVSTNGVVGGASGNLYYANSPYSNIRPGAYVGRGLKSYGLAAFESAPSPSNPNARNTNFNFATTSSGTSYVTDFVEPVYTAVPKVAYSTSAIAPLPGLAIARNSFNGPSYQDFDVSLTKGFHLPEMRVLGDKSMLEFRVDAYNLLNLTELSPTPTTSITSTNFGANGSALGSRTVQIQSRFSF